MKCKQCQHYTPDNEEEGSCFPPLPRWMEAQANSLIHEIVLGKDSAEKCTVFKLDKKFTRILTGIKEVDEMLEGGFPPPKKSL